MRYSVLVQAIFIFGFRVPLFINAESTHQGKWSILFIHTLVLSAVYCYILFVHYSKWRDKLPREFKPFFYIKPFLLISFRFPYLFADTPLDP